MYSGYFDTTQKGNHSSFWTPTVVGGRRPPSVWNLHSKSPTPLQNAPTSTDFCLWHLNRKRQRKKCNCDKLEVGDRLSNKL